MVVMALAACNKNEISTPEGGETKVQFDMGLGAISKTIMSDGAGGSRTVAWANGDAVGIYVTKGDVLGDACRYVHNDGVWGETSAEDAIFVKQGVDYQFHAWYPHDNSVVTAAGLTLKASVKSDQNSDDGFALSDVLLAKTDLLEGGAASNVPLQFSHAFATVEILVTGDLVTAAPMEARLRAIRPAATINLDTQDVSLDENVARTDIIMAPVEPSRSQTGWLYRASVPAQTAVSGATALEVTLANGEVYTFAPSSPLVYERGKYRRIIASINDGGFTSLFFPEGSTDPWDETPSFYEKLYIIDNNSKVYEMLPTDTKGVYQTVVDTYQIGTSFIIATGVDGTAVSADSREWGTFWSISEPLNKLTFNVYTEELKRTTVIDLENGMESYNGYRALWNVALAYNNEVVFKNLTVPLHIQGDRFKNVDGDKCTYFGPNHSGFEAWLVDNPSTPLDRQWFILMNQMTQQSSVWLTGENASLPMEPYNLNRPFNWFYNGDVDDLGQNYSPSLNPEHGMYSYTATTLLSWDNVNYYGLIYLDSNFKFKLYEKRSWGTELYPLTIPSDNSTNLLQITADEGEDAVGGRIGNYCVPGSAFTTPGLYEVNFNKTDKTISIKTNPYETPIINPTN